VFAVLMIFAKSVTGMWLIVLPALAKWIKTRAKKQTPRSRSAIVNFDLIRTRHSTNDTQVDIELVNVPQRSSFLENQQISDHQPVRDNVMPTLVSPETDVVSGAPVPVIFTNPKIPDRNFYPAFLLGLAMTTRGEIGFLIAAIAQTSGVSGPAEVYLVVMWAILLCTLVGPLAVGVVVRRINRVVKTTGGRKEILGEWGEVNIM